MPYFLFHCRHVGQTVRLYQLTLTSILTGCLAASLGAIGFLFWQMALISTGTTTHEFKKGLPAPPVIIKHKEKQSDVVQRDSKEQSMEPDSLHKSYAVWDNFRDIFGPAWFITLILPVPLPQSGHGLYEQTYSIHFKKK